MKPPQVAPHFGVVYLPFGRRWPDVRAAAQRCERLGFDSSTAEEHAQDAHHRPLEITCPRGLQWRTEKRKSGDLAAVVLRAWNAA